MICMANETLLFGVYGEQNVKIPVNIPPFACSSSMPEEYLILNKAKKNLL